MISGPLPVGVNSNYWTNDSLKDVGFEAGKGNFTASPSAFDTDPVFQTQDGKPLAQKQEDKPKEKEPSYTFATRKGEANSVADRLDTISFVPGSYGAMSASIAYIRYWSRKPAAQKTPVSSETLQGGPADSKDEVTSALNRISSNNIAFSQQSESFYTSNIPTPSVVLETNSSPLRNASYQYSAPAPEPPADTPKSPTFFDRVGSLFSANPSGSASLPGAPSPTGPTKYASNDAPNPESAVWQFLFNPEELQLSSGPDYNRAETWGVSDAANHGQPVSWRAHKNRKLTFSKVLLHGYAFGRRVDKLEIGLQDLFMARSGEGMDSPPVLEFVWGSRTFGPCVIQNIQVREKAWDKGLLVNAEVSFELEQIPEWTVNDGFVDVLRPGRQPVLNDQSLEAKGYDDQNAGPPETKPPATEPGGGGGRPTGARIQQLKAQEDKCKKAEEVARGFRELIKSAREFKPVLISLIDNRRISVKYTENLLKTYEKNYNKFQNYITGSSKLPLIYTPEQVKISVQNYAADWSKNKIDTATYREKVGQLFMDASASSEAFAKGIYLSATCKDAPRNRQEAERARETKNERDFYCRNVVQDRECGVGAGEVRQGCEKAKTLYRCEYVRGKRNPVYRKVK